MTPAADMEPSEAPADDPTSVVRRYLELSGSGRSAEAEALEHPDIRFWLSGRLPVSGDLTAAQHHKASSGVHDAFPNGYQLEIHSMITEGGRVALEATGRGELSDGTPYTPQYAMFFEVADGLITSMREYVDTEYLADTFDVPTGR